MRPADGRAHAVLALTNEYCDFLPTRSRMRTELDCGQIELRLDDWV
jgi:hypothetical protein